ncbi:bombesin receptor subtype-3-like [Acanthaster planci]|uniref:Bombesin receptor subtype-3-like n=1 Tax=Acanthaster planci TaxID=133434 RepID=A0A8B7XQ13_ACAPL|nr:bombesin receptor subtype-3-like [Acanthaster planci]XP_022082132.1 bombesin receptor subtype-3-like [Acanthaster planci]
MASLTTALPNVTGNYTDDYHSQTVDVYEIVSMVFLISFGMLGVIGNGILVCIVLLNPDMRSVPNILIASLGLGDFFVVITSVPFNLVSYLYNSYPFNSAVCKFSSAVPIVSHGVSVFTLSALSYDRYMAIVRPMQRRQSNAVRRTYAVAISIWVTSILLGIPTTILAKRDLIYPSGVEVAICKTLPVNITEEYGAIPTVTAKVHEAVRCLIMFVIPLAIISMYYILIAKQLAQSSRTIPCENHGDSRQLRARRRLARTVLVLVVIFAICWIPHFMYRLWFNFSFSLEVFSSTGMFILQIVSVLMVYANSCINPIALCFLSKTYRRYFARYLCCQRNRKLSHVRATRMNMYPMSPGTPTSTIYNKRSVDGSLRGSSVETRACTV